ncbi:30S ribosomal protein S27ae [Candidatus Pacearchaeota archaeon CG10_big_fil_rev_8_21_14_0_10_32_14]|nr:MAG: 30S ribosomal protein S27ae [Candidatus Pacearchaeota archaeon CG10_big_fil_rev_8_21_14_0_10_32_14]
MAKKKKSVKKGKKKHQNNPTSKKYTKYTITGDKIIRAPSCPRCGPGIFLMVSSGRSYCGKCHYTEFSGKPPLQNVQEKPIEKKVSKK